MTEAGGTTGGAPSITRAELLITGDLPQRRSAADDLAREVAAIQELSGLILDNPHRAVERFLELAVELLDAGTAGLSLLEPGPDGVPHFLWDSMAGALAGAVGGTTPRDFSPCGMCLDAGRTILVDRPFRLFEYFNSAPQPLMEGLLVPLYDTGGMALGTLWIVHHVPDRHFCADDMRIMEQLAIHLVLALKVRKANAERTSSERQVATLRSDNANLMREDAFLRSILASTPDCVKVLDLDGRLLFMNDGGMVALEVDDFAALLLQPWPELWPQSARPAAYEALENAKAGRTGYFREPAPTLKGKPKHWDTHVTAIPGKDGEPKFILAISRDVTEDEKVLEHRQMLMHELQHRIKNMQAVTNAIVTQSFRAAQSKEDVRSILTGRLATLNRAQDILLSTSWSGAPVRTVVDGALAPHRHNGSRFRVDGPDVTLDAEPALSLALALHELATNAIKYGALSNEAGTISLRWNLARESERTLLHIRWQEQDGPAVFEPQTRGFGSGLIERMFSGKNGARAGIQFMPAGVICEIQVPIGSP